MLADLNRRLGEGDSLFLVGYKGLTVQQMTDLRRRVREAGGRMLVAKNTLARLALDAAGKAPLCSHLEGPTALVFAGEEPPAVAKALREFADDNEALQLRGGMLEEMLLDAAGLKALADIPPREVLIAKVIGGMNAPLSGLVGVLSGVLRSLVGTLDAVAKKKAESGADA